MLSYSRHIKSKYFNEIKKYKELGLKAQEKRVEMRIVNRNNTVVRRCFDGWREGSKNQKQKLENLRDCVNKALKR